MQLPVGHHNSGQAPFSLHGNANHTFNIKIEMVIESKSSPLSPRPSMNSKLLEETELLMPACRNHYFHIVERIRVWKFSRVADPVHC